MMEPVTCLAKIRVFLAKLQLNSQKRYRLSKAFIKPWNLNNNDKLKENERCNGNCNMGTDHFVEIIC